MEQPGLKILEKAEDMAEYAYIALRNYPKSEKYTLAADTRRALFRLISLILRANRVRNKLPVLAEIDAELDLLRTLVRMGHRLGFLPFKKYRLLAEKLAELGMMLGGWMRYARENQRGGAA